MIILPSRSKYYK